MIQKPLVVLMATLAAGTVLAGPSASKPEQDFMAGLIYECPEKDALYETLIEKYQFTQDNRQKFESFLAAFKSFFKIADQLKRCVHLTDRVNKITQSFLTEINSQCQAYKNAKRSQAPGGPDTSNSAKVNQSLVAACAQFQNQLLSLVRQKKKPQPNVQKNHDSKALAARQASAAITVGTRRFAISSVTRPEQIIANWMESNRDLSNYLEFDGNKHLQDIKSIQHQPQTTRRRGKKKNRHFIGNRHDAAHQLRQKDQRAIMLHKQHVLRRKNQINKLAHFITQLIQATNPKNQQDMQKTSDIIATIDSFVIKHHRAMFAQLDQGRMTGILIKAFANDSAFLQKNKVKIPDLKS